MGVRYVAALALAIGAVGAGPPQPQTETPAQALRRARAYVAQWADTLANLVMDEEYAQEVRAYRPPAPGRLVAMRRRRLHSEILLVQAPADHVWLSFRDVLAVDGKPIGDRQHRFDALFSAPVASIVSTAERIAEEGARFNLGQPRTINTPIAALVFLHPRYEPNTRWTLDADHRFDGRRVWKLRFDQRRPPFGVKIPGHVKYRTSGDFRIEPDSGRIVDWHLTVINGRSVFNVTVRYGAVRSIAEGWVPLRMEDDYDLAGLERLRGTALYSNHRLFRTAGRVIG